MTHTPMVRALPPTNFNSSKLFRFLAELSIAGSTESKPAFAARLGQWLNVADAITLSAALNAGNVKPSDSRPGTPAGALEQELARIRTGLADSIIRSCSPGGGSLPTPKPGAAIETASAYEPYHRFHLAHQRDMELSIRPLRGKVRVALSTASPQLRQLATLDAAFDRILSERERKLLAMVPVLLEKRFGHLLKTHRQTLLATPETDTPDRWMQPGGWLAGFCKELQAALLAELDMRLQPAMGLIEAFSNEEKQAQ